MDWAILIFEILLTVAVLFNWFVCQKLSSFIHG